MRKFDEAFALHQQGRLPEAERAYQAILRRDAKHFEALYNLAHIHMGKANYADVVKLLRRALYQKPNSAEAHNLQGVALLKLGRYGEALPRFEKALALRRDFAEAQQNIGDVLRKLDRPDEAVAHYDAALALRPNWAEAEDGMGAALRDLDRPEDALRHFQKAISLRPDFGGAHGNLGYVLRTLGRLDEGEAAIERAIALEPRRPTFYRLLGESRTFAAGDPHLAAMAAMAADIDAVAPEERAELHFALAKAYRDLAEHERSFGHLIQANALSRQAKTYDEPRSLDLLVRTREIFTREVFAERAGLGDPSPVPVFILGMPRSGSTLVEQILASHPQVFGAGELKEFDLALTSLGAAPDVAPDMGEAELRRIGGTYVAALRSRAPTALRITDKMPMNFRYAGLIHLALPNARIVHTRRDPVDTCLSCFMTMMVLPFTHDLAELGRFYRGYAALMAHWREVLPAGIMLEVDYEDVVEDLEGQARRIVAHCGLEWDDACLAFHQTERPVRTASVVQVRQPLYRDAVRRWVPYKDMLQPLLDALQRAE